MRVLVFGGRDYNETAIVHDKLDQMHHEKAIETIIVGGAPGADSCGKMWAIKNGIDVEEYLAEWEKYGKRAGPIRNQAMLDSGQPDCALEFPGGRGTADMRRRVIADGFIKLIEGAQRVC